MKKYKYVGTQGGFVVLRDRESGKMLHIDACYLAELYEQAEEKNSQVEMGDILINRADLFNKISTECHYDSEHPLESYAKLLAVINDALLGEEETNG